MIEYHIRQTEHPAEDLKRNWSAPLGGTSQGARLGDSPEESFKLWADQEGFDLEDEEDYEEAERRAPEFAYHPAYDAYAEVHYSGLGSWLLESETAEEAKEAAQELIGEPLCVTTDEGDGFDASRVQNYWQADKYGEYWIFEVRV